jgi:threonine dehydrogenase-like Zn-dependent dehydrogenase
LKALVFVEKKPVLKQVPKSVRSEGEALVRVLMAGICRTDVEICKGYMDFQGIPGHEFVGMVEDCDNTGLKGKRVVGEINAGCGICEFCRRGLERHCPNRTVLGILGRDGAMAEYLTLPEDNLLAVPANLSDEQAVFTEPIAAALEIPDQVKVGPGSRVLVIGDGKLGLLITMVLRLTGCGPVLVGKHPEKLAYFSRLGGEIRELGEFAKSPDLFDLVVEASGSPSGWELAVSRVKPRGTLVLKSTYHGKLDFNPAPLVINEVTVIGSRCGLFAPALRLMADGLIDPTPFISGVLPIEQAAEAFARARDRDTLKILITM